MSRKFVALVLVALVAASLYAAPTSITTKAMGRKVDNSVVTPASQLPYHRVTPKGYVPLHSQDFETAMAPWTHTNGLAFPSGWDRQAYNVNGHTTWVLPSCGSWSMWIDSDADGGLVIDTAMSPAIAVSGMDTVTTVFANSFNFYASGDNYQVLHRTFSTGAWSAWTVDRNYVADVAAGWDSIKVIGPVDSFQLGFYYIADYGWYVAVDNITITGFQQILAHDAKVASIDTPATAIVPPSVAFSPSFSIQNSGTSMEAPFQTSCHIYDSTGTDVWNFNAWMGDSVAPDSFVHFVIGAPFTPAAFMKYNMVAWTELPGDLRPSNDTMRFNFRTWDLEVAALSITQPTSFIAPDQAITPTVVFHNNGTQVADFWAYCAIDTAGPTTIYTDSVQVIGLSAGIDTVIAFAPIAPPHQPGAYTARAWLVMNYDLNPANDAITKPFTCAWLGWHAEDASASTAVQWAQSCTGGGSLWVIGGLGAGSTLSAAFQRYTPGIGWEALVDIPTSSWGGASALINGKIYVIGGMDAAFAAVNRTAIYDTLTGVWSDGTAPLSARGGLGGGVVGDKMYLVGGATSSSFPTDCPTYCYDPAADTAGGAPWTTLTACPSGTLILGAPFMPSNASNYVFVVGDYRGNTGHDGYRYEPAADTAGGTPWTVLPSTPADVGGMWSVINHDGTYLYVTGGNPAGTWTLPYSDKTYTWDEINGWVDLGIALSDSGREPSAGGILGNKLYTFGGTCGNGPIDPPPFEWTYLKDYTGVSQQQHQTAISPSRFTLLPNRPNPMNRQTTFSYQLTQASSVKLAVYSITGQLVKTVVEGTQPAGFHSVTWNGRNNNGQQVAAGVYIYNMTSAGGSATRKLVMIK